MANFIATNVDNNHLDVELQPSVKGDNRFTFEEYTKDFRSKLIGSDSIANRIPVYFIASNGGGTMQAYWTARVLSELQIQSQDSFRNHVFALSGASGGAVGMGVSSLLWNEGGEGMKRRLRVIYSNDFMGGTIPRLLLVDPILSILPFNIGRVTNRQEWLTKRYALALGGIDSAQWNVPFVEFWSRNNKNMPPLYFANSTRAENGERYIASPVKMNSSMTEGGLFIEELAEIDDSLSLTFGQCVMLTNRFPFVSNAGKIDQIGHFIDAGYHDNSGMETLMEVYRNVEKYLFRSVDSSSGDTFYPVFIHINYGDAWAYNVREHKNGLQRDLNELSIPITAGIEGVFGERIINKVEALSKVFGDTCVHQIYLPRPDDLLEYAMDSNISFDKLNLNNVRVNWVNTPLGRTITKNQMNYVDSILSLDQTIPPGNELYHALEHLK